MDGENDCESHVEIQLKAVLTIEKCEILFNTSFHSKMWEIQFNEHWRVELFGPSQLNYLESWPDTEMKKKKKNKKKK